MPFLEHGHNVTVTAEQSPVRACTYARTAIDSAIQASNSVSRSGRTELHSLFLQSVPAYSRDRSGARVGGCVTVTGGEGREGMTVAAVMVCDSSRRALMWRIDWLCGLVTADR